MGDKYILKGTEYLQHTSENGEITSACTEFSYPNTPFFQDRIQANKEIVFNQILEQFIKLKDIDKNLIIQKSLNPRISTRELAKTINRSHNAVHQRLQRIKRIYPELHNRLLNRNSVIYNYEDKPIELKKRKRKQIRVRKKVVQDKPNNLIQGELFDDENI